LYEQYNNLALEVCHAFDSEISSDITKKSRIREWAATLEKIMIKRGLPDMVHYITSYLTAFIRKNGLPVSAEKYIYHVLQEYPQYSLNYQKYQKQKSEQKNLIEQTSQHFVNHSTNLPEESSIKNQNYHEAISLLSHVDFAQLPREDAQMIAEKISELKDRTIAEIDELKIPIYTETFDELKANEQNARIFNSRLSVPTLREITENNELPEIGNGQADHDNANGVGVMGSSTGATDHDQVPRSGTAADQIEQRPNRIQEQLARIAGIFKKMAEVEAVDYPVLFREAEDEIVDYLDAFASFFLPGADHKFRYSPTDWIEIGFGWEDNSIFSKPRRYPLQSIYCRNCKEQDYDNDPHEVKGLTRPVMLHPVKNKDRNAEHPELFRWQCPSCKGFDAIHVEITRERVQDNLALARQAAYDIVNKMPLATGFLIYFHEWLQRFRIGETVKMSQKLKACK
jgi:hypothetical protein